MRNVLSPRLALLAVGHLTIDAYSSFFSPLLPLLVVKLDLSLTDVGLLVALASVASSFAQPVFGWLSDRLRRPWFVAFGPVVAAVFMSGLGRAGDFASLAALLMLAGLGVAAFHPQAAALAADVSPRRSLAMALFITGGTLGFALGPLFAVSVVGAFGLEGTWVAALPGLAVSVVLLAWFARVVPHPRAREARPSWRALRPVLRPLSLLYMATVSRSAVSYGFMTFLPLHLNARGYSLAQGGGIVSLYLFTGALGGFGGGWLADRIGGRRVILGSFLGSAPFYLAFLLLPEAVGLPCLFLGSFILQASLPVNVVLGQELAPTHASTISSLLMGAAWGVGALLIGPIGALADLWGLRAGLLTLTAMLAVGVACAAALPDPRVVPDPVLVEPAGG